MALGRRQDFDMHSGDDLDLVITVQDPAGAGVVVSGVTDAVRWQLGRLATGSVTPATPGSPLVAKSMASGQIAVSGLSGYVVTLSGADTAALRTADYYHELEIVVSGRTTTALYGVASIQSDLVE